LAATPRPTTWRFVVATLGAEETIVASDSALVPGRVFRSGTNRWESASHFEDQTCNGFPIPRPVSAVILGGLGLTVGIVVVNFIRDSRKTKNLRRSLESVVDDRWRVDH
jgi:hypothetical protein